jgi:hypothetical protein
MSNYSAQIGKTCLDYSLEEGTLRCWSRTEEAFSYQVNLEDPRVQIKRFRKFRTQFLVGLVGVAVPIWTFGVEFLASRHLNFHDLGTSAYPHYMFFVAGIVLSIAYRKPLRGYSITIGPKAGIVVWRDPKGRGDFDAFVSSICARAKKLPNQAPEPTSTAVTPPADAGDRASGTRGSS